MAIICPLLEIYIVCFFARAILSWFPPPRDGFMATASSFLFTITEPILRPVRRLMPQTGGFDFSFLVVSFGLFALLQIVC